MTTDRTRPRRTLRLSLILSALTALLLAVAPSAAFGAPGLPGSLDTSFSGDGKQTTDFAGGDDFGQALALQPDGKIVVAGYTNAGGGPNDFALARYNGAAVPQCADGSDNDSDNKVDYPNDPGCSSASDDSESPDPVTPPPPARECTIEGTSANNVIRGTSGDDVICAGDGNDIVYAGGGNDAVYGGRGNDILRGEGGNDRLYGGPGSDVLRGGAGRDYLSGAGGSDQLIGGTGNDRLFGGPGADELSGQDGADYLNTRDSLRGNDAADGGAGDDSCDTDRGDRRTSC